MPESSPSSRDVFTAPDGSPRLARCAFLFVDLLGVGEMSVGPEAPANLVRLERALRQSYRDYLAEESSVPAAAFSDTLVFAVPVESGDDCEALATLIVLAAQLQTELTRQGFFMRGGLTLGDVYLSAGFPFGPALVEAHRIESRHAVYPRIVLGEAAAAACRQAADGGGFSAARYLRRDASGAAFVHYLAVVLDDTDDAPSFLPQQRDLIVERLAEHAGTEPIWAKYHWAAEYHNIGCREYGARPGAQPPAGFEVATTAMTREHVPF